MKTGGGSAAVRIYVLIDPSPVTVRILNQRGQLVKYFAYDQMSPGRSCLHWDGTCESGLSCGSGIYFFILETREGIGAKKATMIK
ncbi:MAG: hypothetical protein FJ042_06090 [Candidatus Cloacimonetes bacterium]|nr:hypothetical protein [Candidatus Cloacimonadota bacterium]